ncbi:predicted protein [Naegleria gruberi]|uniref:Predicted protein n=1 Tax=Naegleria gruberi TaxID=5762 RepID=D2VZE8_NAEGR|nr:uncharacterized protein NAEGRDRAFT_74465 [Naegleria gruberi]EFC37780.1 predicted protein [Naegleria gruberi]|eukprot:XP_002670524.1 predicted protein [Naegleria gruberi strain NEG-M]
MAGSKYFITFTLLIAFLSIWFFYLIHYRLENFSPQPRRVIYNEEGFCGFDGKNYKSSNHDDRNDTTDDQSTTHNNSNPNNLSSSSILNININNNNNTKLMMKMMHKGPCGICSNLHDYEVYNRTRLTLTRTATLCAVGYLLLGERVSRYCLSSQTGMSELCVECWLQNIQCTTAMCMPVCVKHFVRTYWERLAMALGLDSIGEYSAQFGKDNLSPCFKCDEMECGNGFKKCSGLNRRNAGFETDIPRPDEQMWKGN